MFSQVCVCPPHTPPGMHTSLPRTGRGWQGGVHGRGVCVVVAGGGVCMAGGMRGRLACMAGAPSTHTTRYDRSIRGRYASYWNAFWFLFFSLHLSFRFVAFLTSYCFAGEGQKNPQTKKNEGKKNTKWQKNNPRPIVNDTGQAGEKTTAVIWPDKKHYHGI